MPHQISTPTTTSPRSRKTRIAIIVSSVLILATGCAVVYVGAANTAAEETARHCAVALKDRVALAEDAKSSTLAADKALDVVTSTTLPMDLAGAVHASASYADRPAVAAVKAIDAGDGVAEVEAVAARKSGAEHISDVTDTRAAVVKVKISGECVDRDDAEAISALTATSAIAMNSLDESVEMLLADFRAFQTEEAARVAAEIEAARVTAEAEAARVAAEAAAEASRIAAEQAAAEESDGSNSEGGDGDGNGSGGGGSGGGPSGGGSIGLGTDNGGACWTSNGMGGTMPC